MPLKSSHRPRKSHRTSDEFTLANVLLKNNGMKVGQSYYVEGTYTGIRGRLHRLCKGKAASKQSGNGWMITPEVDIPVPLPPPPITIPAGMPTRATIEDVVAYLKMRPIGTQCGMTEGPKTNANLWGEFDQRGIQISPKGPYGNRIITITGKDQARVKQLKTYKASKRTTDKYTLGNYRLNGGIPANQATFVQGNHPRIVKQLLKLCGTGNYSVAQVKNDSRGAGWMVTLQVPYPPL